jgi:hypothetical protein
MSSIEQQLSRFPARNGFKTLYKQEGERLLVKQVMDNGGTLNSFKAKGWKEYVRAAQPFEAKQFQRTTADDQIAELRRIQAELKKSQEDATQSDNQSDEGKKQRGRPPKTEQE